MEGTLRRTVKVGWVEGMQTNLAPGTTAEVRIASKTRPGQPLSPEERKATLERMWALSDKAIAEGMETWDLDRVNAEVRSRRYGND